jgi:hypothetical protein
MALPPDAVEPLSIREFVNGATTSLPVVVPPVAGWTPGTEISSLWGRAPSDIWAAGADVAHFDGVAWSRVADVPDAVRDPAHQGFESVVTGDATATWLVGPGPRFFREAAGAAP